MPSWIPGSRHSISSEVIRMAKRELASKKYAKRSTAAEFWHRLRRNKGAMIGLALAVCIILIALIAPLIFDYETQVINQNIPNKLKAPSSDHPFGTDELGRDIMARVMYGARYSLAVGIVAVAIAMVVGTTLGCIAGFMGGTVSEVIMRITDIFCSVPTMLMAIAIVSAFGVSLANLMVAVGITSAPQFVRIARASIMTVRHEDYVEAARAIGMPSWQIVLVHMLPNSISPLIVQATQRLAGAIISASSLSFLGLGVPAPTPEWGSMLSGGRNFIRNYPYLTMFPGIAIMLTVLAFNLLGDGVRDAIDPKLKR